RWRPPCSCWKRPAVWNGWPARAKTEAWDAAVRAQCADALRPESPPLPDPHPQALAALGERRRHRVGLLTGEQHRVQHALPAMRRPLAPHRAWREQTLREQTLREQTLREQARWEASGTRNGTRPCTPAPCGVNRMTCCARGAWRGSEGGARAPCGPTCPRGA